MAVSCANLHEQERISSSFKRARNCHAIDCGIAWTEKAFSNLDWIVSASHLPLFPKLILGGPLQFHVFLLRRNGLCHPQKASCPTTQAG